jgi:hypothetical protein
MIQELQDKHSPSIDRGYTELLQEVNHLLCWLMIDHPSYEAKEVAVLNHKICKKIREIRGTK